MKAAMKYFFFWALIINIGCQSCEKDPIDPPPPVKIFHTVTVTTADGVTIFPGTTKVEAGKSIGFDLNSALNKRYQILLNGVVVAGYLSGSYHYQIAIVTADANIQIVSEAVTYAVTASAGIGGTVTPLSTTVEYGSDLPLNIVENAEYTLTSIRVNGVSVAITKPYILKNITVNSDVKVDFTLTQILILTNGADNKSRYWNLKSWEYYDVNHVYEYQSVLNPNQLTDKSYYYSTGKMEMFNSVGVLIANDFWNILPGNVLTLSSGGRIVMIVELSDTKFVYEQKAEFTAGRTEYLRTTMTRQ